LPDTTPTGNNFACGFVSNYRITPMKYLCAIFLLAAGVCLEAGAAPDLVMKDLQDVPRHPLHPVDKAGSVLVF
jgi:hypothetical protein